MKNKTKSYEQPVITSKGTVSEAQQTIAKLYPEVSSEIVAQSLYQKGEAPKEYLDRLLKLYSEPYQQAFLSAAMGLMHIAEAGLAIFFQAEQPEKIEAVFPRDINTQFYNSVEAKKVDWSFAILQVNPEIKNEMNRRLNLAIFHLKDRTTRIVASKRLETARALAKGQKASFVETSIGTKIAQRVRRIILDESAEVELILNDKLPRGEFNILVENINEMIEHMSSVNNRLPEIVNPVAFKMETLVRITNAASQLGIYTDIGSEIQTAWRYHFGLYDERFEGFKDKRDEETKTLLLGQDSNL